VFSENAEIKERVMDRNIYPFEFLYDGDCPICRYDVTRLHKADHNGHIIFIDVNAPDFKPEVYGQTLEKLLARIHGRRADGVIVDGPEVFRLAFSALGYGWLIAPTRWPLFNQITEITYRWFARHRGSLARRFGHLYISRTPECDLFCQPGRQKEK
jgi:predicted DCC family thiol-disulfide oxidoreductase YuxK